MSYYGFSLHVPGVNEIEHLFVTDHSFMKCRFKHLPIFLDCLISFIYRTSLCILDMNHYQIYILQHLMVCGFLFLKNFWPCQVTCRILVPCPGIESVPPVVKAQNLNHWTAREVSRLLLFLRKACIAMNFLLETPFAVSQILYGCVLFL